MINLSNFVKLNINRRQTPTLRRARDTLVLYTDISLTGIEADKEYTSNPITDNTNALYKPVKAFFDNGGVKLIFKAIGPTNWLTADMLNALSADQMLVAVILSGITGSMTTCISHINDYIDVILDEDNRDVTKLKLFFIAGDDILSTSNQDYFVQSNSDDVCLIPAAYLTQLDLNERGSIKQYTFTPVKVADEDNDVITDNSTYVTLKEKCINCVGNLANKNRALGGDSLSGVDFTNQFALICLQQDLTDALIDALSTKLKGFAGCAAIQNTCVQTLNKYISNGYIVTDKVWDEADWTVTAEIYGNEVEYTVVEAYEPLDNGYKVLVLPYSTLSVTEKAAHQAPKIYIALAESYGIRQITIEGEVI